MIVVRLSGRCMVIVDRDLLKRKEERGGKVGIVSSMSMVVFLQLFNGVQERDVVFILIAHMISL